MSSAICADEISEIRRCFSLDGDTLVIPTIRTPRLVLRPFEIEDAPAVHRLAGDWEVAATTKIPHPYDDGMAEAWIASHRQSFDLKRSCILAVELSKTEELLGTMGFNEISRENACACLDYWIGKPYWNCGYATEALRALAKYGFEDLLLHRVQGFSLSRNPASIRVMQKAGLRKEGHLRKHVNTWGAYEDLEVYAILRSEYFDEREKERVSSPSAVMEVSRPKGQRDTWRSSRANSSVPPS